MISIILMNGGDKPCEKLNSRPSFVLGCFSFFYLHVRSFTRFPCFTASSLLGNVPSVTTWSIGKY